MKIGYVQSSPIFGNKTKNFEQIEDLITKKKADLIVFPELFATGYTFISRKEVDSLAEGKNGETANFLKDISKKTGAIIVGGFIEKAGDDIYNSALMIFKKKIIGIYRKLHLYYKEKLWFKQGNLALNVFEIKEFKIGMMICFDWFFPETMRSLSLLGADIIAHPANLVLPYCQNAMIIRCLENRVYAVTSNRIGEEKRGSDNFLFTGASQITSYNGEVLSRAPNDELCLDFRNIEVSNARNKKLNEFNDLFNERRIDYYRL